MIDRLQEILQREGLTAAKFASALGVQPSAISHLLSGRNKPGYDFICRFMMAYPAYNIEWLLVGKQPMLKSDIHNQEVATTPMEQSIATTTQTTEEQTPGSHQEENKLDLPVSLPSKQVEQPVENYPQASPTSATPRKVIILYEDSTFESYDNR